MNDNVQTEQEKPAEVEASAVNGVVSTCSTCKAFGAQGVMFLQKEEGDRRYCSFALFDDYDNPNAAPSPSWKVTYGNAGGSKGQITVHKDYGCINHNAQFDEC